MVAISVSQQVRETLSQLQAVTIFISRPWKCTKILKITFWVSVTSSLEKAFKRQFQMQRRTSTIKPWKLQGGRLFSLKLYLMTKNDIVADNFSCCRASAGSRPYSWSIWDFWFDGSMVRWFDGPMVICDCSPVQSAVCLAAAPVFHLGATRHFVLLSCKISAEIVVYRMLAVFLNG